MALTKREETKRETEKNILKLLSRDKSQTEIALTLRISTETVRNYLRRLDMLNPKRVRGGKRGAQKLREKAQKAS